MFIPPQNVGAVVLHLYVMVLSSSVCRQNGLRGITSIVVDWFFWILRTMLLSTAWRLVLNLGIVTLPVFKQEILRCQMDVFVICNEILRKTLSEKCISLLCDYYLYRYWQKRKPKWENFKFLSFLFFIQL
jgi:hypothetical protein